MINVRVLRYFRRHATTATILVLCAWLIWAIPLARTGSVSRTRGSLAHEELSPNLNEHNTHTLAAEPKNDVPDRSSLLHGHAIEVRPLVIAPPPRIRIPNECVHNRWYDMNADAACYLKLQDAVRAETGGDPLSHENLCWGYAAPLDAPYNLGIPPTLGTTSNWTPKPFSQEQNGGGILFHMILLTGLGEQAPMTLVSWLATQVCDDATQVFQ